ncbi:MAG TPA: type II toxin-antitoxin system HicA family toxin [Terriglobia bacterium]|nr:type II toxin-antitoxin system HicA family toxin [Terriglobia bacterium]
MSHWPSTKARKVFRALLRSGWSIKAQKGSSHIQISHPTKGEFTWAFHDSVEIGPRMLARIAKHTGLKPEDL